MKKLGIKILCGCLLLAAILSIGIVSAGAETAANAYVRYCAHCGREETWQPFTGTMVTAARLTTGHYYLTDSPVAAKKTIPGGNTVCLELNGNSYLGNRHVIVESGAVLNIQDSAGGGVFRGRGIDAKSDGTFDPGRAVWLKAGGELNLYSGTMTAATSTTRNVSRGGVVAVYGTFNMYGGVVKNGIANELGGNIFVDDAGEFNMYGGSVTGGTAPSAPCVYSQGKTLLAGDASVEELLLAPLTDGTVLTKDQLTIRGAYTGTVSLSFAGVTQPDTDVGESDGAELSGAQITLIGSELLLKVSGKDLVTGLPAAATILENGEAISKWDTLAQAVEAAQAGQTVQLGRSTGEAVTARKNILLDLNGCSIQNTLAAADGVTVSVMDSSTADYDISDGEYGTIAAVSGSVLPARATEENDVYVAITEEKGISYHAVGLNIHSMSLKPGDAAIYFNNNFQADTLVQQRLESFGIAMSITGAPDETTMTEEKHYTSQDKSLFGGEATGTLLTGIMKEENNDKTNLRNGELPVYARAYVKLTDGSYVFGVTRQRSLKEQLSMAEEAFDTLSEVQKNGISNLTKRFARSLDSWALPRIKAFAQEDDTLNVFFVSNSTCYYFTDELYGLLEAAGYQNVNLGLVYYSGCSIKQHYEWSQSGKSNYQFRVWDKEGLHVFENYSLDDALMAYDWDVISFDNNARSFASGDVQTSLANAEPYFGQLLAYIKNRVPDARYLWHEVWANEIGYSLAFNMETVEQRTAVWNAKRGVAQHMEKTYGVDVVPTGDAWEPVRDLPLFTTPVEGTGVEKFTLCSRVTAAGGFKDDFTHDGDIGGGQYLNACVWFEVLTGTSCLPNTYRPEYTLKGIDCSLSEEKIDVLKNAAHDAVKGWGYEVEEEKLDILFIGDSASYYWTDELYGLLHEAGYKNVRVCNAYYSTSLKNIWTWLDNDTPNFTLYTVDANGRTAQEKVTLKYVIGSQKWDCISFHQTKSGMYMEDRSVALANTEPYLTNLLTYTRSIHPEASYYWDENWVCEIGYSNSTYAMESKEQQEYMLGTLQHVAREVSKKHGLTVIPNGDAWTPVRDLELFRTPVEGTAVEKFTLCSRVTAAGAFKDDLGHDGDIGGGQYLNACVAFEVLTGESCLGNTYDPQYTLKGVDCSLTEEKRQLLQNAAHDAVANWNS